MPEAIRSMKAQMTRVAKGHAVVENEPLLWEIGPAVQVMRYKVAAVGRAATLTHKCVSLVD